MLKVSLVQDIAQLSRRNWVLSDGKSVLPWLVMASHAKAVFVSSAGKVTRSVRESGMMDQRAREGQAMGNQWHAPPVSTASKCMGTFKVIPQTWVIHLQKMLQRATKQFLQGVDHGCNCTQHFLSPSLASMMSEFLKKRFSCNSKAWVFFAIKTSCVPRGKLWPKRRQEWKLVGNT